MKLVLVAAEFAFWRHRLFSVGSRLVMVVLGAGGGRFERGRPGELTYIFHAKCLKSLKSAIFLSGEI